MILDLLDDVACAPAQEPLGPGVLKAGDTPFPLRALDVQARISGPLASVDVRQTFANPCAAPAEAVYIFPLPAGSAVHRFRLLVGDRVIEGVVKERAQARQEYAEGLRKGHRAALLEQERDNVFTVTVGNLPPGEEVTVELSYAGRLERDLAESTFRFPLVVAERYIPGDPRDGEPVGQGVAPDTTRVRDASRITPPRLAPGLRSGARLSLKVLLDTGGLLPLKLASSQHATSVGSADGSVTVELSRTDELLDRDFLLRFRLAAEEVRPTLLVDDRHFLLSLVPPRETRVQNARDVLFLLDRSGSMGGSKMEGARRAVARFLDLLEPGDRFALEAFDDRVEGFRKGAFCDGSARPDAVKWLARVDARGGTEILQPLMSALGRKPDPGRVLCVVLITDGQVGNEPEIFRMVQWWASAPRLFTLGIDTAVNDAFLRQAAALGRGTCELVTPGEDFEQALQRLARETGRPLVVDLELADAGLQPDLGSLAPSRMPDLFAARPSFVLGRHSGAGDLDLRGRTPDGSSWQARVVPQPVGNPAIGVVWARERVTALEDRLRLGDGDRSVLEAEILALSLEYQILTRFTAFVLVDSAEVVNPEGRVQTLVQPVQTAAEWDVLSSAAAAPPSGAGFFECFSSAPMLARMDSAPRERRLLRQAPARVSASKPSSPGAPARSLEELVKDLLDCLDRLGVDRVEEDLQLALRLVLESLRDSGKHRQLLVEGTIRQRGDATTDLPGLRQWAERLQREIAAAGAWWRDDDVPF